MLRLAYWYWSRCGHHSLFLCSGGSSTCVCPMNGTTGDATQDPSLLCRDRPCASQCNSVNAADSACLLCTSVIFLARFLINVKKFGCNCFSYLRAPVEVRGRYQLGLSLLWSVYFLEAGAGGGTNLYYAFQMCFPFLQGETFIEI